MEFIGCPPTMRLVKHTDSVLCCSIDSTSNYAISGGIDDMGYVWDLNECRVKFECDGHKDSVVSCGFSLKSTYAATADMKGLLQVWKIDSGHRVFDYEVDDINFILWHNHSDSVILAGTITGDIYLWNINDSTAFKCLKSQGHAANTARLLSDGIRLVVGYANGTIRIFDLKKSQQLICVNDCAESEVTSLDVNPTETLIAVGFINSHSKIINVNSGKIIGELQCAAPEELDKKPLNRQDNSDDVIDEYDDEQSPVDPSGEDVEVYEDLDESVQDDDIDADSGEASIEDDQDEVEEVESVETLAFSLCGNYLGTATVGGQICIWDVPSRRARRRVTLDAGITTSFWNQSNHYIVAGLDGVLRIFDKNLEDIRRLKVCQGPILDCFHTKDLVMIASDDYTCTAYKMDNLLQVGE
ncbi:Angio-associated migratory cell protein [Fragariocoptes setiger]|uniref:Angio-associated migratory cell protein n=1 Tax=Fragariocoptes setiger TaxID=1670756 RepID=A0ABQ7S8B1_9ACAR|nr:Angio-associated migratory cell protein [Fragariocoptes setiger]